MENTASGRFLVEPQGRFGHVPYSRGWALLESSTSWFDQSREAIQATLPETWFRVVDPSRGRDTREQLAPIRPDVIMPAWGPHLTHSWGKPSGTTCGPGTTWQGLSSLIVRLDITKTQRDLLNQKIANLIEVTRPDQNMLQVLRVSRTQMTDLEYKIQNMENVLKRAKSGSGPEMAHPGCRVPGGQVPFTFDVTSLRLWGKHFALQVQVDAGREIREFFGLPKKPSIPYHLTVAIVGSESHRRGLQDQRWFAAQACQRRRGQWPWPPPHPNPACARPQMRLRGILRRGCTLGGLRCQDVLSSRQTDKPSCPPCPSESQACRC